MKTYEKTKNGIEYIDEIASSDGAAFILFPTAEQTPNMIKDAISEIFNERDVVSLKVANDKDWDERYRSEIFAHPFTRPLRWYEINADDKSELRAERLKGTSVVDYINQYILPFTTQTKTRNIERYGNKILDL
jgi:hypothetical protein